MLLKVEHVTGKAKDFSLRDICFSLDEGYILGVAGKNGAGKTTLFRYIMEPKQLYNGMILLDGKDIRKDRIHTLNQIGFISEENQFFECYTIIQNVELLGMFYENWDQECFLELLDQMELIKSKTISSLSRGERIKFQIAFAAAHRPRLYLMDEPTAGMDPIFRKQFFRLLQELMAKEDCSVIISTHIQQELETKVDIRAILEEGRLVSIEEAVG